MRAESRTGGAGGRTLPERQWGTVREDYSPHGNAWEAFPHDHARSRAYRWGEDGLLGICDRECRVALALALWNGRDPILKERLFGLTGHEGNHGEDVKELYYYLDATPTASYLKALYKYPQAAYPVLLARRREPASDQGRPRVRARRHRRVRRPPLLRRRGGVRQGCSRRRPAQSDGHESGPGRGADSCPADGVVPEHVELGRRLRGGLGQTRDHRRRRLGFPGRPFLARPLPGRRGRGPVRPADAPVHGQRDQRGAPVRIRERVAVHEGRLRPVPRGGTLRRRQPGAARDEGRRALPPRDRRRRVGDHQSSAAPGRGGRISVLRKGVRPRVRGPHRRGRLLLLVRAPARARPGGTGGHPAGVRRADLVEAVLLLRRPRLAARRPGPTLAAAPDAQRRLAAPLQSGRDLDARQVGVPVVCGLGSRLPHAPVRAHRPGVREAAARAPAPRVVHAPERPDPRVRMGVLRREPACPRVGRLARLQDQRAPR